MEKYYLALERGSGVKATQNMSRLQTSKGWAIIRSYIGSTKKYGMKGYPKYQTGILSLALLLNSNDKYYLETRVYSKKKV